MISSVNNTHIDKANKKLSKAGKYKSRKW